jgi:hypothetical protein
MWLAPSWFMFSLPRQCGGDHIFAAPNRNRLIDSSVLEHDDDRSLLFSTSAGMDMPRTMRHPLHAVEKSELLPLPH